MKKECIDIENGFVLLPFTVTSSYIHSIMTKSHVRKFLFIILVHAQPFPVDQVQVPVLKRFLSLFVLTFKEFSVTVDLEKGLPDSALMAH